MPRSMSVLSTPGLGQPCPALPSQSGQSLAPQPRFLSSPRSSDLPFISKTMTICGVLCTRLLGNSNKIMNVGGLWKCLVFCKCKKLLFPFTTPFKRIFSLHSAEFNLDDEESSPGFPAIIFLLPCASEY